GRWTARGAPWSRAAGSLAARWEADIARTRGPGASATASRRAAGPHATLTRRGVLAEALGLTGLAALAVGGISALAKGGYRGSRGLSTGRRVALPSSSSGGSPGSAGTPRPSSKPDA